MTKLFFSLPEAAAELGISRIAVFKKVKKGNIAAIRIGRNWAISAETLLSAKTPPPRLPDNALGKQSRRAEEAPANASVPADTEMNDMGWD